MLNLGGMEIALIFCFIVLLSLLPSALSSIAQNAPTWKGVIISAILGLLPLYLILCFFGVMGEEKQK